MTQPSKRKPPRPRDLIPGIGGPTYLSTPYPSNEGVGSNTPGGFRGPGGEAFGPQGQRAPFNPKRKRPRNKPTTPTPGSVVGRRTPTPN